MYRTYRPDHFDKEIASSPKSIRNLLVLVGMTAGFLFLCYFRLPSGMWRSVGSKTVVCDCLPSSFPKYTPAVQSLSINIGAQLNGSEEHSNWFTPLHRSLRNSSGKAQNGSQGTDHPRYVSYPEDIPMDMRCRTCAYVTGSGHMAGSRSGREIDEHDCVIRSNGAPTKGYESDVGRKTTMRTVDVNSLCGIGRDALYKKGKEKYFEKSAERDIFVIVYGSFDSVNKTVCLFDELMRLWPEIAFYVFTTEQYHNIRNIFTSRVAAELDEEIWISNGFTTLLLLREICDEIDVYGITDAEYCDREKSQGGKKFQYHYYDRFGYECDVFRAHSKRKTWAHRFLREKKVFGEWAKEWGNLHFHNPQWPD